MPFTHVTLVMALAAAMYQPAPAPQTAPAPPAAPAGRTSPRPKPAPPPAPEREAELRRAIAAEPREISNYLKLADYLAARERPGEADAVLRDALPLDPLSRTIFERRLLLFLKPFDPRRLGAIALEWAAVDGTNAVPALIAAGHHMQLASRQRGDGSDRSEQELERALAFVEGSLPGNPDVPELLGMKSNVLQAHAALLRDPSRRRALLEEAQVAFDRGREMHAARSEGPSVGGALSPVIAAMTAMPPFGPPGAIRVGFGVPAPRRISGGPLQRPPSKDRPRPGASLRALEVELVIDPAGRVTDVYAPAGVDGYDQALVERVKQWLYEPTVVQGQPRTVLLNMYVPLW
jgi:hypothetical protein